MIPSAPANQEDIRTVKALIRDVRGDVHNLSLRVESLEREAQERVNG